MQYSLVTLALLAATAAAAPAPQVGALRAPVENVPVVGSLPVPVLNENNNNGNTANTDSNNTENTNTNTNTNTSTDNRNTNNSANPANEQAAAAPNSNTDNRSDTTVQDCSAQNKVMSCCSIEDVTSNNENDLSSSSSITSVDITKSFTQTEFTQILKSFSLDSTTTEIKQVFLGGIPTVSRVTRRQATAGSTIACTPQNSCNNNQQPQCFDNDVSTGPIFFTLIQQPSTNAANIGSS